MNAHAPVRFFAHGIVDAGDDGGHVEHRAHQLGGHDVRVVAIRHRDERVGLLDTRRLQHVFIYAYPQDTAPGELLWQTPEGGRLYIDDGHGVARFIQGRGEPRTNPTAADDYYVHESTSFHAVTAPSTRYIGGRSVLPVS